MITRACGGRGCTPGPRAHGHRDGLPRAVWAWCRRSDAFRLGLGKTDHSMSMPPDAHKHTVCMGT